MEPEALRPFVTWSPDKGADATNGSLGWIDGGLSPKAQVFRLGALEHCLALEPWSPEPLCGPDHSQFPFLCLSVLSPPRY